ncbi:hypothetical protein BX666DRAFT_659512 [Dichotomocladium elegans]|nr:hypothetical protein BX666DRAFT_659512 [Dichotomocladium elegans]
MDRIRGALVAFWDNHVHFLQLHYLYIAFMILLSSGLYYCQPGTNWNYIDALFTATTGVTNTGLNTVPMSELSTYQVAIMYFNSFLASHTAVSYIVLVVRKHYFSKRFEDILLFNKARRMREENRRRERQKRHDVEIGLKRQNSAASIKSQTASNINRRLRRFSLTSTASSPIPGVRSRHHYRSSSVGRPSRRSISSWMTNPADIRNFFRDIRYEHKYRDGDADHVVEATQAEHVPTPSSSADDPHIHPFDNDTSASTSSKSTTIPDTTTAGNNGAINHTEGEESSQQHHQATN